MRLSYRLASLLPLRERVVLATSHKTAIDGNLAVIRDALRQHLPPSSVRAFAYAPRPGVLGLLRVALHEMAAAALLATSRVVIVDDYFFPLYPIRLRSGTAVIQVWHACGAFKKFGLSLGSAAFGGGDELTSRVAIHSNYSVCLTSSESTAVAYSEAFGQPLERFDWQTGIPRTDALVDPDPERIRAVREALGLPDDKRVILYAPTFRGERTSDARSPDALDLALLARELGDRYVLLLRAHPFVRDRLQPAAEVEGFATDVSDWPDINELLLVSDVLLTDYSSVIFEFALLDRAIAFFAPDHAEYERERGFYFDYRSEGPGPVFESTAPLAAYLARGEFDLERVERFRERWWSVADGHATQRFIQRHVLPQLTR